MHAAPHRNNSDFQLRHFIAGSCYTADGAWALLYNQRLDIKIKLASTRARLIRRQAKQLALEAREATAQTNIDRLELEADQIEFNSGEGLFELAIAGAEAELATIQRLMDELEPQRKYAHLPLLEATEAAQRDEWLGEFKARCENFLFSTGTIPADQLEAMRKHPDFEAVLAPHIHTLLVTMQDGGRRIEHLRTQKLLPAIGAA